MRTNLGRARFPFNVGLGDSLLVVLLVTVPLLLVL
jgi:hypothetical protein